jgi:hypothetical protein
VLTENLKINKLDFNIIKSCSLKDTIKKMTIGQVLVAHTCNPSYSGGRDQEDHDLKPTRANSS